MNKLNGFSVTSNRYDTEREFSSSNIVIKNVSLSEALREINTNNGSLCRYHVTYNDCGLLRSISFNDWNEGTREYYENGIEEIRTIFLDQRMTASSVARLCRFLKV